MPALHPVPFESAPTARSLGNFFREKAETSSINWVLSYGRGKALWKNMLSLICPAQQTSATSLAEEKANLGMNVCGTGSWQCVGLRVCQADMLAGLTEAAAQSWSDPLCSQLISFGLPPTPLHLSPIFSLPNMIVIIVLIIFNSFLS